MRRMRDLPWRYLFLAIPAVAAALGIQFLVRKWTPDNGNAEVASTLKPSQYRDAANRKIASKEDNSNRDHAALRHERNEEKAKAKQEKTIKVAQEPSEADIDTYAAVDPEVEPVKGKIEVEKKADTAKADAVAKAERKTSEDPDASAANYQPSTVRFSADRSNEGKLDAAASREATAVAKALENAARDVAGKKEAEVANKCASIEYRGDGPEHTKITKDEWGKVMTAFHGAKGELLTWLRKHKRELPDRTAKLMEKQVRELRIQRPPAVEEPDLTWRGIGVWTQDVAGAPMLRVGSGFVKLVNKQAARGKFEMTRLVAQAWAPCELQRVDAGAPWDPLLKCLNINEERACAAGTYSEGGWAVSSAIATKLANPGCAVPAFADASMAACLKKFPLPLSLADNGVPVNGTAWKEARR